MLLCIIACVADITGRGLALRSSRPFLTSTKTYTGKRPQDIGGFLRLFVVGIMLIPLLIAGCSHTDEGTLSQEANHFFNQGNYGAALGKYEQLIENHPAVADRVLFEMGIVYAYPKNAQKDYQKSLDCFQKILKRLPG